ncbi:hypothetical protein [Thalassovita sp.]|uniref:hypothetical protein n=1 Tax=Thalassovita sp. TaxID=1979401 RepID=UPI0029DE87D4|nr:hypothetical protein [Thalassovita sp.]
MQRIGNIMPSGQDLSRSEGGQPSAGSPASPLAKADKQHTARFAELKMTWALQVAADKRLPDTALRVALVWPFWLNSKTLLAWPAQQTVAELINSGERAVRAALKRLEECNHLVCINEKRGGRISNRYRIVIQDEVLETLETPALHIETGTDVPVSPEQAARSARQEQTSLRGTDVPGREVLANRGTLERTHEKTKKKMAETQAANSDDEPRGPRVTKEEMEQIMRQTFGDRCVSETGYLQRE